MKKLVVIALTLMIVACQSNPEKANKPVAKSNGVYDRIFTQAMVMGCNKKHPGSQDICKCHGQVIFDNTPADVKQGLMLGTVSAGKLAAILMQNQDKLDACGAFPEDKKEPIEANLIDSCAIEDNDSIYYTTGSEVPTFKAVLTQEQQEQLASVDESVTDQQLKEAYWKPLREKIQNLMKDSGIKLDDFSRKMMIDAQQEVEVCTMQAQKKFYLPEELNAVRKLAYSGASLDETVELMLALGYQRRGSDISRQQQDDRISELLKCEVRKCNKK
ncbi:hypothetical protein [Pelagibaculum spongiae]|uniref:Lipoprotein n=1 Tax=Pelagibaculum spongiae TaxID=2080658 RepID=A0A2V1GY87_9GAMM|nr:hypothetical protein [Pelagibaculum spongiae]PVZ70613.1 hypothetical protein DC094_08535 [Pelagibaculum spongiae]